MFPLLRCKESMSIAEEVDATLHHVQYTVKVKRDLALQLDKNAQKCCPYL